MLKNWTDEARKHSSRGKKREEVTSEKTSGAASTFLRCPPQQDRNFGDFRQANPQTDRELVKTRLWCARVLGTQSVLELAPCLKPRRFIPWVCDHARCFVEKQRWGLTLSACCHSCDILGSPASPVLPWAAAWCREASWNCGCSWPGDVLNLESSGAAARRAVTSTAMPWVLISKCRILVDVGLGVVLVSPAFFTCLFQACLPVSLQKWRHQVVLSIPALSCNSYAVGSRHWTLPLALLQPIYFAPEEGCSMVNTLGQTWQKNPTDWQEKEKINSS